MDGNSALLEREVDVAIGAAHGLPSLLATLWPTLSRLEAREETV